MLQIGELAAMGTALLWTLSAMAWTSAGRYVGALSISFVRLVVTCGFLLAYGRSVRGLWLPSDADADTWVLLGLSGFVGFFVADACLFKAFLMIGPRLTLLIQALTAPITALISWSCLNDRLTPGQWLAMVVTLSGVTWVILERRGGERRSGQRSSDDSRQIWQGILLALVAAVGQSIGFVLSKQGIGQYDAVAATFIRVLGALIGYILLISIFRHWPAMLATVRHRRVMATILYGAFIGPFLGVILCMIAVRHCHAGVVTTILSTMPVLVLPLVILFHKEKVSYRAAAGAVLSVAGVAMLVL